MQKYLTLVRENLVGFSMFEIKHVPRSENSRADLLSKLASTKSAFVLRSVVEEVIPFPGAILQIEDEDWRTLLKLYRQRDTAQRSERSYTDHPEID